VRHGPLAGSVDLVIDRLHETMTLPQTFGRRAPVVIRWAEVVAIRVEVEERKDPEGHSNVVYAVMVDWRRQDAKDIAFKARLAEFPIEKPAEALAAIMRSAIDRRDDAN
jgi:hypothetical protein